MFAKLFSAATVGINAELIEIEVDLKRAYTPSTVIVGLADTSIKESKDRIRSAFNNSGYQFPWDSKITVNLAPANIRKEGSLYDLPIAIGLLSATGQISSDALSNYIIIGELALEGKVRPVNGALPITLLGKEKKFKGIILPKENAYEASIVQDIDVIPVENLQEAVGFLNKMLEIPPFKTNLDELFSKANTYDMDFIEIKGNEQCKRALAIASAGAHNVLMIGPPGSGKTMLAKRLNTILPKLTLDEAIETTKIYSVAGLLSKDEPLIITRPFRSPHHTISEAGLVGGGTFPRPGEISLSHNGVLFLDEIPEFSRKVLETLRQPLEDRKITLGRAQASVTYPANFTLIATMNPCRCGYFGDKYHQCVCTPREIMQYRSKLSGPLLDRIDIHIVVSRIPSKELITYKEGTDSKTLSQLVAKARKRQEERFKGEKIHFNSQMTSRHLKKFCKLEPSTEEFLYRAIEDLGFSARAYTRILKIARTIADMEDEENVKLNHISEAIQYRSLDRDLVI